MSGGYIDKNLKVDLSNSKHETFSVSDEAKRAYLGGSGMASHLYLEHGHDVNLDALDPLNPFYIMTGPLTGTPLPGVGRFTAAAKSPLTGMWGEGNCGGNFGPELKFAGFDGIEIIGKAEKPSYILIEDGEVSIKDASDVWGKDTYEVASILKERHKSGKAAKVFCIGPAGENQVSMSAIVNDCGDVVGRCGLGAVMGSKNLKAIVARGTGKPPVADSDKLKEVREQVNATLKKSMLAQGLKSMGTAAGMAMSIGTGDVPIKNWGYGVDKEAMGTLSGFAMNQKYLIKGGACYGCPVACKRVCEVKEGPYKMEVGPGPEYETCATFGTMLLNHDLAAVCKINELCNKLGLDTISTGATISFAYDLYDNEIIGKDDTDGLELTWGNVEPAFKLVEMIANKEGIGEILAQGSRKAAEKFGDQAKDFAVTVKGLEVPMHDPRAFHGIGLNYAMSTRGACHLQHMMQYVEMNLYSHKDIGIKPGFKGRSSDGKAELAVIAENMGVPAGSAVICIFVLASIKPDSFTDMLNVVTGFDIDTQEVLKIGERLWYLKRGITNLHGITKADDTLPKKIMTALAEGPAKESIPDLEKMRSEYYAIRKLDDNGKPTREVLEASGLKTLADRLGA